MACDKAYGSRANRAYLRKRGIKAVIPEKAARVKRGSKGGRPPAFDAELYKRRNLIERCNNRIKEWRGIELVSALIWLRSLRPE